MTLAGRSGPQDLGILMAERRRYFADAGIYASLASPLAPRRAVTYVVDGTDDLGVAQLPQVVRAKAMGAPVLAVGSLVSQPMMAMIWLKGSGIGSLADLEGMTIAVPGVPVQEEFLRLMLARAGLSRGELEVVKVGYDLVPALLEGRADAIFGGFGSVVGAELEARGAKPVVTPSQALGVPAYEELVLIARADTVAEDPGLVQDFMAAVIRGTAAAIEDPRESVETVDESVWGNPETDRRAARAQVEVTLPLLSRTGRIDPERAQRLIDWMADEGIIEKQFQASTLLLDEDQ